MAAAQQDSPLQPEPMREVIRKVLESEVEARRIVQAAEAQARDLLVNAQQQARSLVAQAGADAERDATQLIESTIQEAEEDKLSQLGAAQEPSAWIDLPQDVRLRAVRAIVRCVCGWSS